MTHADGLLGTSVTFRRLTGLTPAAFRRLLGEVTAADQQPRTLRASHPGRRKAGAGRKPALPLADRLLMLLVYYRTYVPHTFLGFLFGIDDSNVSRSNRRLATLRLFSRQFNATVLSAARQKWIDQLRDLLADLMSQVAGLPVLKSRWTGE